MIIRMETSPERRSCNVLLVEDETSDIRIITSTLRQNPSIEVTIVRDGEEAMDYLKSRIEPSAGTILPSIILLDIHLPRKTGWELLSEIRAHPLLRHIPVVILATSSADRDVFRAYQATANAFVTKPGNLDDFVSILQAVSAFWFSQACLPKPRTPSPEEKQWPKQVF